MMKSKLGLPTKLLLGFVFVVWGLLIAFSPRVYNIVGQSMSPNLHNGDVMFSVGRCYDINRFDIITFQMGDKCLVKRVIGLPGERVQYQNGMLRIDGFEIEQPFIALGKLSVDYEVNVQLGWDEYFVMGDNRPGSYDSRSFGPIKESQVSAKILFKVKGE